MTTVKVNREQHRFIALRILQNTKLQNIRNKDLGVNRSHANVVAQQLSDAGINEFSQLLTVPQAAVVLGVIPRRVRLLCQEGRLGTQVGGGPWIIQRDELAEYLQRDHSSGQAGRAHAVTDKMVAADRYGRAS